MRKSLVLSSTDLLEMLEVLNGHKNMKTMGLEAKIKNSGIASSVVAKLIDLEAIPDSISFAESKKSTCRGIN